MTGTDADTWLIDGGRPLCGQVTVSGAKNAALPIMAACILADGPVQLDGVPQVSDVATLSSLLGELGLELQGRPGGLLSVSVRDQRPYEAEPRYVLRMRASCCVLGPLLARRGRARLPLPGGCRIGPRPIDLHLKGLHALGADIQCHDGWVVARARRLRGAVVDLRGPRGPTVTGTCNVLSAAVLASGQTRIIGAAREPEVVDLARFLCRLGARISGLGTDQLLVRGVSHLSGARHRLIPDRIEAGTFMIAAAITGGSVRLSPVRPDHLGALIDRLRAMGVAIEAGGTAAGETPGTAEAARPPADCIQLTAACPDRRLRPVEVVAEPYPGLPTDLQAPCTALLATVPGRSRVRDTVFPERFQHVAELVRMGADITRRGDTATVTGVARLRGAAVTAADLRTGAALVLAALAARGQTTISQVHHLYRGYERLAAKLAGLGAEVRIGDQRQRPGQAA